MRVIVNVLCNKLFNLYISVLNWTLLKCFAELAIVSFLKKRSSKFPTHTLLNITRRE